ncbi:MAG: hypothetical protein SPE88_04890 [Paludibacteraceae bacterium]|nr:hypothetical protein [Paludibacteraceae bacterium]
MKKLYSLFAALMVAVFALAQTTPTVTVTLSSTGFTVTPEPITETVFYVAQATADYNFSETVTPQTYMQNYVTSMDPFKFGISNTAGAKSVDFENCGSLTDNGSNTILAVTVSVIDGVRTLTSEVVRVDTVFTKTAGGGEEPEEPVVPEEPIATIEAGKYYIATYFDEDMFLASMGSGRTFNLGATLSNGTTPTEIHEFEFEAVEGKQAVFYIKNGTKYLNTSSRNNWLSAGATPNEAYEWKVEVLDEEEGNIKISHVQTAKVIFFQHYVDEETSAVTNWYVCQQAVNAPETNAEYPFLIPVEDEPETPVATIEEGKYYVSTLLAETDKYLLTSTNASAVMLPATKYVDENTPAAVHEFDFVAVEGKDACFTIQDNTGAFLNLSTNRMRVTVLGFAAAKPEKGAIWKVSLQDEENHVTIANTDYAGDLHCLNLDGEIGYFFGNEASYTLPVLTKVPGASTNIQEADIDRQVIKTIENGQLILNINGVRYNILGIAL